MTLTPVKAIKGYMESEPHGRKVTMDELRALDKAERREIAAMCAEALGEMLAEAEPA